MSTHTQFSHLFLEQPTHHITMLYGYLYYWRWLAVLLSRPLRRSSAPLVFNSLLTIYCLIRSFLMIMMITLFVSLSPLHSIHRTSIVSPASKHSHFNRRPAMVVWIYRSQSASFPLTIYPTAVISDA